MYAGVWRFVLVCSVVEWCVCSDRQRCAVQYSICKHLVRVVFENAVDVALTEHLRAAVIVEQRKRT